MNNYRLNNIFIVFMAITAMSFAYFFLQHFLRLNPCPLCVFQRIGVAVMGIFALLAVVFNPSSLRARLGLWLAGFMGVSWSMVVAARHVWLQYLPAEEVPSCGPGLDYWVDVLPIFDVIKEVFKGSGECADIVWTFMGLSIPEQSLILFTFLFIIHVLFLLRMLKNNQK